MKVCVYTYIYFFFYLHEYGPRIIYISVGWDFFLHIPRLQAKVPFHNPNNSHHKCLGPKNGRMLKALMLGKNHICFPFFIQGQDFIIFLKEQMQNRGQTRKNLKGM